MGDTQAVGPIMTRDASPAAVAGLLARDGGSGAMLFRGAGGVGEDVLARAGVPLNDAQGAVLRASGGAFDAELLARSGVPLTDVQIAVLRGLGIGRDAPSAGAAAGGAAGGAAGIDGRAGQLPQAPIVIQLPYAPPAVAPDARGVSGAAAGVAAAGAGVAGAGVAGAGAAGAGVAGAGAAGAGAAGAGAAGAGAAGAGAGQGPVVGAGLTLGGDTQPALIARCAVGAYFGSVVRGVALEGAEAELQSELGLSGGAGNQLEMPMNMVFPGVTGLQARGALVSGVRARADAVSPAPQGAGEVQTLDGVYVPTVFPSSIAARLCMMYRVGIGEVVHTTVTTALTADVVPVSTKRDATPIVWGVKVAEPIRIAGRFTYRMQDAARLAQVEERLRMNLIEVLQNILDQRIVQGGGTGGETLTSNGFYKTLAAAQTTTFGNSLATPGTLTEAHRRTLYLDLITAGIDGLYAETQADVDTTLTPAFYRALLGIAHPDTDLMLADQYTASGAKLRGSQHCGTGALAVDTTVGIMCKSRGKMGAAVCSVWPTITLIRDQTTKSAEGEVAVTANMLVDLSINRPDNFRLLKIAA